MIRVTFFAAALAASTLLLSQSADARHPHHHPYDGCGTAYGSHYGGGGYSSYYSPGYGASYSRYYSPGSLYRSYYNPLYSSYYRPGYSSFYGGYPYSGYGRTGISIGIGTGGYLGSPYGYGYPRGLGYGGYGLGRYGYGGFGPGIRIGF